MRIQNVAFMLEPEEHPTSGAEMNSNSCIKQAST